MAGSWLLFFLVLVVCMAVVAFTVQQRSISQQLEAGRFRVLTRRMRDLDAALVDFDSEFATKFDSTVNGAVAAANGSMDDVQAANAVVAKATGLSVEMSTRLVKILDAVKRNYEDLEALASKLSDEERVTMFRVSEKMRARHAELASRIKDDGLTGIVDVTAEGFTVEPGLRRSGVELDDAGIRALDAATDLDAQNGLTLKESLYYRMSEMPEVMTRANDLVAGKPESPVFRMLRELRTSNALGLSALRTAAYKDANLNDVLREFAAISSEKAATMSGAAAGVLNDLRKSFADLALTQAAGGVAQNADQTAAAANVAAKVKDAADKAAAAAARDSTLSAAARKTAADWAVTANRNYMEAALKAEESRIQANKATTLLALARAAASESAASDNVDRYKRIAALWNKTPYPWDGTPNQQGMIEYLSDSTRGALKCALSVRKISQAYDGPLFRLKCPGAVPETQDFWATEDSVLSSQPNKLGSKVDMWSGGSPIQVLAWFDQSGAGSHAVFAGAAEPTLTLYGNMAVNVAFDDAKGLRLPNGMLPADDRAYLVSCLHGKASPGATFFSSRATDGKALAIGVNAAGTGYYSSWFSGPDAAASTLTAGKPSKGVNIIVANEPDRHLMYINNGVAGEKRSAGTLRFDKDPMIGGRNDGAAPGVAGRGEFTLNRLYVLGGAATDAVDLAELNMLPGA
jgi:hypothetical protein